MGRIARVDVGDNVYHVINRAVGRMQIFTQPGEYEIFEALLFDAVELIEMRLLSYSLMPNHWHLELYPKDDGDMGEFMHWLTNAHTRRVHSYTKTIGTGPLYQGRYKSFLIQKDEHLLTVLKYIERNPVRARLAKRPENWRWGSAWIREYGNTKQKKILADSPVPLPRNYNAWINEPDKESDLANIRCSANRGAPYGGDTWVGNMISKHDLLSTVRKPGRPANKR
ncbi:MAG: transposase [bacterium]|nr:transposase [bacterium]